MSGGGAEGTNDSGEFRFVLSIFDSGNMGNGNQLVRDLDKATAEVARLKAVAQWKACRARDSAGLRRKAKLLQRAILVSLFTVLPPDRVGVIRTLRYDATLVQDDDLGWLVDLREHRDIHKTRWVARLPFGSCSPCIIRPFAL